MRQFYNISLITLLILSACQKIKPSSQANNSSQDKVIYGDDNRVDFYQITDTHWLTLAQSTAALVDVDDISWDEPLQQYQLTGPQYGPSLFLCPDEPFYNQPRASFCSGFLVGPDVMVTAGHCIRNQVNCNDVRFVFGFYLESPLANPMTIEKNQVYQCKNIIHQQANAVTGVDYAIIRLDRKVSDHQPLLVRTQGEPNVNDPLTVIGFPSGLPGKYADGGVIRDNSHSNFMLTNLDTYGGNSGSAVFNSQTRLVEGILARGDDDFKFDPESQCRRSNICGPEECRGEDVVRISLILDHLTPKDLGPANSALISEQ